MGPVHETAPDTATTKDKPPRVFAVVIGINEYLSENIPNLHGCLRDAQAMRKYLEEHFGESHITFLSNKEATRDAILDKLEALVDDRGNDIQKNDPIVVFYAGHGSRAPAEKNWFITEEMVETLVPYDEVDIDVYAAKQIHGIPDYTLKALLTRLAEVRGNNITVILDCCHSGGATRDGSAASRGIQTRTAVPENLDEELIKRLFPGHRSAKEALPANVTLNSGDTHVLLAACRKQESAREALSVRDSNPCGYFSDRLFDTLDQLGDKAVTYAQLVDYIRPRWNQHPGCDGDNKGRFLFKLDGPPHNEQYTVIAVKKSAGTVKVNVGSMAGVGQGTMFVDAGVFSGAIIFNAVTVELKSSILKPLDPSAIDEIAVGSKLIISDWGKAATNWMTKVFVDEGGSEFQLKAEDLHIMSRMRFVKVQSAEGADLVVTLTSSGEFNLSRTDPRMSDLEVPDVKLKISLDKLPYALDAVAKFNYFLEKDGSASLAQAIRLEMYALAGHHPDQYPNTRNMVDENRKVKVDEANLYGFRISNSSDWGLFVYLFYFDLSDYSIQKWYCPHSNTMQAPLPAGTAAEPKCLAIGYGNEGGHAFGFSVPENVTTDAGFVKLFVSNTYLNLEDLIPQESAKEAALGKRPARRLGPADTPVWAAIAVEVTIVRAGG